MLEFTNTPHNVQMSSSSDECEIYDVYVTDSDLRGESEDEYPCFSEEVRKMYELLPNLDEETEKEECIEKRSLKKAGKLFNNGVLYMNKQNFNGAAQSFRAAATIYSGLSKWSDAFDSYCYCGKMLCKCGRMKQAICSFKSARIIAEQNGLDMTDLYIEMGDIYTQEKCSKLATRCFGNAIHLLRENGTQQEVDRVLERLR